MSNETIGGLVRLSRYMGSQLASAVAVTGGTIDGVSRFSNAVEAGTTTTNLVSGGTTVFGSTAATTFTLDAPTKVGIDKYLHCNSATTAANITLATGIQLGDNSTLTKAVFSGKASLHLKSDSTAIWYPYGGYQSSLISLSS